MLRIAGYAPMRPDISPSRSHSLQGRRVEFAAADVVEAIGAARILALLEAARELIDTCLEAFWAALAALFPEGRNDDAADAEAEPSSSWVRRQRCPKLTQQQPSSGDLPSKASEGCKPGAPRSIIPRLLSSPPAVHLLQLDRAFLLRLTLSVNEDASDPVRARLDVSRRTGVCGAGGT